MASILEDKNQEQARLNRIGMINKYLGNYDDAIQAFEVSISIVKELEDKNTLAHRFNGIAGVYFRKKEHETAISYYEESRDLFMELGQEKSAQTLEKNIQNVKDKMNK